MGVINKLQEEEQEEIEKLKEKQTYLMGIGKDGLAEEIKRELD